MVWYNGWILEIYLTKLPLTSLVSLLILEKICIFRHCWEKMVADSITLDLNRGQWVIPVQQRQDVVR